MPKQPTKAQRKSALLKEAKDSLGIKGKRRTNAITTATFLGFAPKQGGKDLNPSKTGDYATAVENEVIKRYVNTLQPISTSITMKYTFRFKHHSKNAPSMQGVKSTTITGTRATIDTLIQEQLTEWRDDLDQNSPEIMERFEDVKVDKIVALSVDKKQKFISKDIRAVKMKRLGALKLDYDYLGDCSWDRQLDTCVFDWLFHEYGGKSGFKTFLPQDNRELAYDNMNHLFTEVEDGNPLTDGVTINQLERFAEKFRLPMMAFDKTEKLFVLRAP